LVAYLCMVLDLEHFGE